MRATTPPDSVYALPAARSCQRRVCWSRGHTTRVAGRVQDKVQSVGEGVESDAPSPPPSRGGEGVGRRQRRVTAPLPAHTCAVPRTTSRACSVGVSQRAWYCLPALQAQWRRAGQTSSRPYRLAHSGRTQSRSRTASYSTRPHAVRMIAPVSSARPAPRWLVIAALGAPHDGGVGSLAGLRTFQRPKEAVKFLRKLLVVEHSDAQVRSSLSCASVPALRMVGGGALKTCSALRGAAGCAQRAGGVDDRCGCAGRGARGAGREIERCVPSISSRQTA